MPQLTHRQVTEAHKAILELAKLDGIPAVPTGFAIRRGEKILGDIRKTILDTHKDMDERHIKRDEEGNKVVAATNERGAPSQWEIADPEAYTKEHAELYDALIEVPWSMPASFLAGSSPKPGLLIILGDLLTEEGS